MSTIMTLKQIANIGKSALAVAVGLCENYKMEVVVEEQSSDCNNCLYTNASAEQRAKICNHCPNSRNFQTQVTYINERHKYNLNTKQILHLKRLSYFQLQQYMLYHFLNINSDGIVKYVSVSEIANYLNCTTRTVKNNNIALAELGLICYSTISSDLFSVCILGYKDYRKKKQDGGVGYIPVSLNFFQALLNIDDINATRLAIRMLIKNDDDSASYTKFESIFTYEELKNYIPSHIQYKSIISKTLNKTSEIFKISLRGSYVMFSLKKEYNGKLERVNKSEQFSSELICLLKDKDIADKTFALNDLVKLSFEYGIDSVKDAIDSYIINKEHNVIKKVDNFGGYIRRTIENVQFQKLRA